MRDWPWGEEDKCGSHHPQSLYSLAGRADNHVSNNSRCDAHNGILTEQAIKGSQSKRTSPRPWETAISVQTYGSVILLNFLKDSEYKGTVRF